MCPVDVLMLDRVLRCGFEVKDQRYAIFETSVKVILSGHVNPNVHSVSHGMLEIIWYIRNTYLRTLSATTKLDTRGFLTVSLHMYEVLMRKTCSYLMMMLF